MAYTSPATVIVPLKFTLKIGLVTADQIFTCDATGVHLTSNPQTTTVAPTLCALGYDDVASVRHDLVIDFQGFLDEPTSLWYWLWTNTGANGKAEFSGTVAGRTTPMKIAANIRVVAAPLDCIAGDVVTGTVTLPCTATPVITMPSATLLAADEAAAPATSGAGK